MNKMPESISGYSQIEYLTVFITIIFGVVATEYFNGWRNMLRYRKTIKIYPLHLLWTIFTFLTLIQNWYGIWPRTRFLNHGLFYFFYALVPMLVFHFITVILFPTMKVNHFIDFKQYYLENSKTFFRLYAIYFLFTIISSFIYSDIGNIFLQNALRVLGLTLALLASHFKDKVKFHYAFVTLSFLALFQFLLALPK